MRIGTLVRISGQVVRTHPVHPELVRYLSHTHTHTRSLGVPLIKSMLIQVF